MNISGLTIANGQVFGDSGGGIRAGAGSTTISQCQIVSNVAAVNGGGLITYSNAHLTVEHSTIAYNQAAFGGGGVYNQGSTGLVIRSCTVFSNQLTFMPNGIINPRGGGIALAYGSLTLIHSTIASNLSTYAGGGIDNIVAGLVDIRNTIVFGNIAPTVAPDVLGPFSSGGYNLIGITNGSTGFSAASDQPNVDPMLGPLADYGGPTLTMALRAGSPAIDKGKSFAWPTDQRGATRPLNDPSIPNALGGDDADIGAFEVDPTFRIVNLSRVGNDVGLSLLTVLGKNYRAEYTNDLASGTGAIFTNNVAGNGWLLWVTNSGGANQSRRFYRGAILP